MKTMSTEQGTITRIEGNKAFVLIRRSSMCETCKSSGVCNTLGGGQNMEAEAFNTAAGQVGDRVVLKIPSKSLLKISFVFYMIPVIFLIAGVMVGIKTGGSELYGLLFGVLGCAFSFLIVRIFAARVRENKEYMPEVIKVFPPPGQET